MFGRTKQARLPSVPRTVDATLLCRTATSELYVEADGSIGVLTSARADRALAAHHDVGIGAA